MGYGTIRTFFAHKNVKIFFIFLALLFTSSLWQNCGRIPLQKIENASTQATLYSDGLLKIFSEKRTHLRLVVLLDMSQSMYSGPCEDAVDTLIDGVNPLSCYSPTGVDPDGKRFQLIIKWIDNLHDKVSKNYVDDENVKILIQPFSNSLLEKNWTLENNYNSKGVVTSLSKMNGYIKKLGLDKEITPGFISLKAAKNYTYLLWGVFNSIQAEPYPREIPSQIISVLPVQSSEDIASKHTNPQGRSSGTSIIQPAVEKVNSLVYNELGQLTLAKKVDQSYFEFAYLSDGVPKPHPAHMKKVIDYVWRQKKDVCDTTEYGPHFRSCADDTSVSTGWKSIDASSCSQKCSNYLQRYVDEGSVIVPETENSICASRSSTNQCLSYSLPNTNSVIYPRDRWSAKNITCTQCFEVLRQYKYNNISCPSSSCTLSYHADTFKTDIVSVWGDWVFNNHVHIIQSLKETENIFLNKYTSSKFHMNFMRVNSNIMAYQIQSAELGQDLNWITKAYTHFGKKQYFGEFKTLTDTPELFPELAELQTYRLGIIYALNKNALADSVGRFSLDRDKDGVIDSLEIETDKNLARSDGLCMDIIRSRFGQCLNIGCDPKVDRDNDGLNECEEKTLGTDDLSPDSDKDSLLDLDEVTMGFNPTENDQKIYFNGDTYSNFEHFIKGFPYRANLSLIPDSEKIQLIVNYKSQVKIKNSLGMDVELPTYEIKVQNLPLIFSDSKNYNEIVVRLRIDNVKNSLDYYWYTKSYKIDGLNRNINVDLSDFTLLRSQQESNP